jgi:hypothetical protein
MPSEASIEGVADATMVSDGMEVAATSASQQDVHAEDSREMEVNSTNTVAPGTGVKRDAETLFMGEDEYDEDRSRKSHGAVNFDNH